MLKGNSTHVNYPTPHTYVSKTSVFLIVIPYFFPILIDTFILKIADFIPYKLPELLTCLIPYTFCYHAMLSISLRVAL